MTQWVYATRASSPSNVFSRARLSDEPRYCSGVCALLHFHSRSGLAVAFILCTGEHYEGGFCILIPSIPFSSTRRPCFSVPYDDATCATTTRDAFLLSQRPMSRRKGPDRRANCRGSEESLLEIFSP